MEWYDQISEKANANTMNYVKTQKRKNHEEREREENFTIIMVITMEFSDILEFLDLNPPPRWKESSIYTGCVCLDKSAECSALFKHLTAYLRSS